MSAVKGGAVFAEGHWRRRDALAGLNAALLAALEDAFAEPLRKATDSLWRAGLRSRGHKTQTLQAAARRGLLRLEANPKDGADPRWGLTKAGREAAVEIQRRAQVRRKILRQSRAKPEGATP